MCEQSKDNFISVTQKTYTRKYGLRPEKAVQESDYHDILAGPFTEYLVLPSDPSPEHPLEDIPTFHRRMINKDAKLKKYIDPSPNLAVISADYKNRGRTVYQMDYCDIEGGFESSKSRGRKRVILPPDWGEVPITTQRASYRLPARLATWDLRPRPVAPRPSALQPNHKEREILQVVTGVTEYEDRLGALGELVLADQLHGTNQDGLQCAKYQQMLKERLQKTAEI